MIQQQRFSHSKGGQAEFGIRHREIEHSEDLELIEIVSPADFESMDVD